MKKILIIAGGMLSLTIILAILVAILIVTFIKEEGAGVWQDSRDIIQRQSVPITQVISSAQKHSDSLVNYYQSLDNSENCQQLAAKLSSIEAALANGSLVLPRASIAQIFSIKNRLNGVSTSAKNLSCEQATKVIDTLS
ncbi:hypothetical protein PH4a_16920 [Proteus hauseri]|nr:hypothetical protein PH4a_16920 [Proteus hauseri]